MDDIITIEQWQIGREEVEREVGRMLSNDEWRDFAEEVKGRIDNYCNELYNDLIDQLGKDVFKPKYMDAKPKTDSKHLDEEIW